MLVCNITCWKKSPREKDGALVMSVKSKSQHCRPFWKYYFLWVCKINDASILKMYIFCKSIKLHLILGLITPLIHFRDWFPRVNPTVVNHFTTCIPDMTRTGWDSQGNYPTLFEPDCVLHTGMALLYTRTDDSLKQYYETCSEVRPQYTFYTTNFLSFL